MKKTLFIVFLALAVLLSVSVSCSGEVKKTDTTKGTTDGHDWVQLWANGPKWAAFNVGSTITDYAQANQTTTEQLYSLANVGGYYNWGKATDRRTSLSDATYCTSTTDIQGTENDTAKNLWGANWQLPTKDNFTSLTDESLTSWTWCDGGNTQYTANCTLKGYKVSGKGDYANNSIFIPANGYCFGSDISGQGDSGQYWTSNPFTDSALAYKCYLLSSVKGTVEVERSIGFSVRAILAE